MSQRSNDQQTGQSPAKKAREESATRRPVPNLGELADILVSRDLSKLEYEQGDVRICLSRSRNEESAGQPLGTNVLWAPGAPVPAPVVTAPKTEAPAQEANIPTTEAVREEHPNWNQHPGAVRSPMVGMVYVAPEPGAAPFVSVGDEVKAGQTLLIIEAMKVLNPIKAPKSGKVVEILVHDQEPVEYDEVLVVIE